MLQAICQAGCQEPPQGEQPGNLDGALDLPSSAHPCSPSLAASAANSHRRQRSRSQRTRGNYSGAISAPTCASTFVQVPSLADTCTSTPVDLPMPSASMCTTSPYTPAAKTVHDFDLNFQGSLLVNEHSSPTHADATIHQGSPDTWIHSLSPAGSIREHKRCRSRSPAAGPLRAPRLQVHAAIHQQKLHDLQTSIHASTTSTAPMLDSSAGSKFACARDILSSRDQSAYEQTVDGNEPDCSSARSSSLFLSTRVPLLPIGCLCAGCS